MPNLLFSMIVKRLLFLFLLVLATNAAMAGLANGDTTAAKQRAIANLKSKGSNILPTMLPTLNFILNNYTVDLDIEAQKKNTIARAFGDEKIFLHAFDTAYKAPLSALDNLAGSDKIIAQALYCDCYALPKEFFPALNDMAYEGDYTLTHAAMALVIISKQKCSYDTAAFARENANIAPKLANLITTAKATSSIGIEAVALLYLTGNAKVIKKEWIADILRSQQSNGSWNNNDRATIFGLWVVLEAEKHTTTKP